jgi:hypothetical protein
MPELRPPRNQAELEALHDRRDAVSSAGAAEAGMIIIIPTINLLPIISWGFGSTANSLARCESIF